jgi:transcriptional regulator with XRE-family HTH domain
LGLKQKDFAALVGAAPVQQSLYESNRRQLGADYLVRLDHAGVDVMYVLTGRRSEDFALSEQAARLITAYMRLPEPAQRALTDVVEALYQGR